MPHYIENVQVCYEDELQSSFKTHYMGILDTILQTGTYKPPRRVHPLKRIFFGQSENYDYIFHASLKVNSFLIKRETYLDICNAYVTAYDECVPTMPHKAVLIRKYLIDLLSLYVQSCRSIKDLEPQRSIVQGI